MTGRFYVAVCTRRKFEPEWVLSYGAVLGSAFMLAGRFEDVRWNINTTMPLERARTESVREALEWGADYIVFLDDDVVPPSSGLVRLHMDAVPIVSGLYKARRPPRLPMMMRRKNRAEPWKIDDRTVRWDVEFAKNYPRNQLVQVDAVPLGFCFILREVFEKTPPPWFKFTELHGEDCYFSWKAAQSGFKLYVDTNVNCYHFSEQLIGEEDIPREEFFSHWKWQNAFMDK
jgi:GT2 family glycosyltransferase